MINQASAGAAIVVRDYDPTQSSRFQDSPACEQDISSDFGAPVVTQANFEVLDTPKEEQPILPAAASMPRRRSLRLHPQLCVEAGASTKPRDIELFFLSGNCPRCGRRGDKGQRQHLERSDGRKTGIPFRKSLKQKMLELKLFGLMEFTQDYARFAVIGSTGIQYIVELNSSKKSCDCPDHITRKHVCKHMYFVYKYLDIFKKHQRRHWHQAVTAKLVELSRMHIPKLDSEAGESKHDADCKELKCSPASLKQQQQPPMPLQ